MVVVIEKKTCDICTYQPQAHTDSSILLSALNDRKEVPQFFPDISEHRNYILQ